jgi:hypothetical protein
LLKTNNLWKRYKLRTREKSLAQITVLLYWNFRFVVGPYEEKGYAENRENLPSHGAPISSPSTERRNLSAARPWALLALRHLIARTLRPGVKFVKECSRHPSCPHPFSCLFYTLQVNNNARKGRKKVW